MTNHKQKLGAAGEQLVVNHLIAAGWQILARNLHTRHGELDIVVSRGRELIVVEVKARQAGVATAAEALTPSKFKKLRHAAWEAQQADLIPLGHVQFALAALELRNQRAKLTLYWRLGPNSW